MFLDLRIPALRSPLNLKSFAGTGSYDEIKGEFTWTRTLDYRGPGIPDVGKMTMLTGTLLQEDGVLPGDNYREIWQLLSTGDAWRAEQLRHETDSRVGVFVRVGSYIGIAFGRPASVPDRIRPLSALLGAASESSLTEPELEYLSSYFGLIASIDLVAHDAQILHSTKAAVEGRSVFEVAIAQGWSGWHVFAGGRLAASVAELLCETCGR
jgi:hypothetical protein